MAYNRSQNKINKRYDYQNKSVINIGINHVFLIKNNTTIMLFIKILHTNLQHIVPNKNSRLTYIFLAVDSHRIYSLMIHLLYNYGRTSLHK